MYKQKVKATVILLALATAAIFYFILKIDKDVFFYVACAFGLYGYISAFEDLYLWLIKEPVIKTQAKHQTVKNNLMEDENKWMM